jgi:hypothetical protein
VDFKDPEPGIYGRIADGGGPELSLEARMRRSGGEGLGLERRPVKPFPSDSSVQNSLFCTRQLTNTECAVEAPNGGSGSLLAVALGSREGAVRAAAGLAVGGQAGLRGYLAAPAMYVATI